MDDHYLICDDIFNLLLNHNDNILLIYNDNFNPLDNFSHIVKKKNILIDILIENNDILVNINNDIKGEECETNIKLYSNIDEICNKKYTMIVIFYLNNEEYLENILNTINNESVVYIYCCLCGLNKKKIFYKNYIRNKIMEYTKNTMSYVLPLLNFLEIIENNLFFKIKMMKIYKKNNYIIYGNNTVYETILIKK